MKSLDDRWGGGVHTIRCVGDGIRQPSVEKLVPFNHRAGPVTSENRKKASGADAAATEASESKGEKRSRSRRATPAGQIQKSGDQVQPETGRPENGTTNRFPIVGI